MLLQRTVVAVNTETKDVLLVCIVFTLGLCVT